MAVGIHVDDLSTITSNKTITTMHELLSLILNCASNVEQDAIATVLVMDKNDSVSNIEFGDANKELIQKCADAVCALLAKRGYTVTNQVTVNTTKDEELNEDTVNVVATFTTQIDSVACKTFAIERLNEIYR